MDRRIALLQQHGLSRADKIGEGGESEVFALGVTRVLRVHRREAGDYTRRIGELYAALDRSAVPFALPEVLEVESDGEVSWSIERRLPGRPLDSSLGSLRGADRNRALCGYIDGAAAFGALGAPRGWSGGYGELFTDEQLRAEQWGDLLADRLTLQLERARPILDGRVTELDEVMAHIVSDARAAASAGATLVHGDWFPGNVLLGDDLQVSAAIDLGWLTVVGDVAHDVLSAVVFCEVRPWLLPGDAEVLLGAASRHLGRDTAARVARARRYEQARFAFVEEDHYLHTWCVEGLQQVAGDLRQG